MRGPRVTRLQRQLLKDLDPVATEDLLSHIVTLHQQLLWAATQGACGIESTLWTLDTRSPNPREFILQLRRETISQLTVTQ